MLSDNEELPPVSSDEEAEKPVKRRVGRPTKHRFTDRGVAKVKTENTSVLSQSQKIVRQCIFEVVKSECEFELSEQFSNANT